MQGPAWAVQHMPCLQAGAGRLLPLVNDVLGCWLGCHCCNFKLPHGAGKCWLIGAAQVMSSMC